MSLSTGAGNLNANFNNRTLLNVGLNLNYLFCVEGSSVAFSVKFWIWSRYLNFTVEFRYWLIFQIRLFQSRVVVGKWWKCRKMFSLIAIDFFPEKKILRFMTFLSLWVVREGKKGKKKFPKKIWYSRYLLRNVAEYVGAILMQRTRERENES